MNTVANHTIALYVLEIIWGSVDGIRSSNISAVLRNDYGRTGGGNEAIRELREGEIIAKAGHNHPWFLTPKGRGQLYRISPEMFSTSR